MDAEWLIWSDKMRLDKNETIRAWKAAKLVRLLAALVFKSWALVRTMKLKHPRIKLNRKREEHYVKWSDGVINSHAYAYHCFCIFTHNQRQELLVSSPICVMIV